MSTHSLLSGTQLHDAYHYVQETDPGAVGSKLYWLKVSTGEVKRRNDSNSAWLPISPGFASPLTTKGDLMVYGTGTTRLPVGGNDLVLTADSAEPLGIKWAAAGAGSSGWVGTPPVANNSTGVAGQYSADNDFFYICKSANLWFKTSLQQVVRDTFTYVAGGDTNGLFYWLGQLANGGQGWINPYTASQIDILRTTSFAGTVTEVVDRVPSQVYTTNAAGSWYGFDLKTHPLRPNKYTIQARNNTNSEMPRNWKLQGSNSTIASNTVSNWNAATWTDLDTRTSDTTLTTANQWGAWTVTGAPAIYRYIRWLSTGVDSSGTSFLGLGEFEIYGTFF